jgi:hypothetical protein
MTESRKDIEARRVKRQLGQTAAQRYEDNQNDIGALLDLVSEEIRVHAERAAQKPKDWSFAGDLTHVRESLKNILEWFLVGHHEWTETEASRFIEDHLEAMREDKR